MPDRRVPVIMKPLPFFVNCDKPQTPPFMKTLLSLLHVSSLALIVVFSSCKSAQPVADAPAPVDPSDTEVNYAGTSMHWPPLHVGYCVHSLLGYWREYGRDDGQAESDE